MTAEPQSDSDHAESKTTRSTPRLIVVFACLLVATGLAYYVSRKPPGETTYLPKCAFYQVTHLHCPGCGSTRLTHALLNGAFYNAFRNNPLLFISLPFLVVGVASELKRFVCGRPLFNKRLHPKVILAIFFIVSSYWVFRNLPFFPFNWLAPIG